MQKTQETRVPSLGLEDPLKKEMATYSSILAWKIPREEKLGGLQAMGHKELDSTECACTSYFIRDHYPEYIKNFYNSITIATTTT